MITADFHTHCNFSPDSGAAMESMVERAVALGLTHIALTDHVDYGEDGSPYANSIDYGEYTREFNRLKEKYASRINVVLGVEMGFAQPYAQRYETLAAEFPFEFIICSSHSVRGLDLYGQREEFFGARSKAQAYEDYFREVLENITAFSCFNVYGHLDFIVRYGIYNDNSLRYKDYNEVVDAILKALIERGKGLELNMSGFRYGLNQSHPQAAILKRYRELGGEIITVGSDAHRPQDIASHFDNALELLNEAGFSAYTIFQNRKPVWIDLGKR